MRANTPSHLRRLVLAVALLGLAMMHVSSVQAADNINLPPVRAVSFTTQHSYALEQALQVGVNGAPMWYGLLPFLWRGAVDFAIPEGSYSTATLTFSTSGSWSWNGTPVQSYPRTMPFEVGLFDVSPSRWWQPGPWAESDPFTDLGEGVSYGSIQMAWPTSYAVTLSPAALNAINAAAGAHLAIGFAASENTVEYMEIRVGTIENAVLHLTPAVPEPAEWAMLIAGLALIGFMARRRIGVKI